MSVFTDRCVRHQPGDRRGERGIAVDGAGHIVISDQGNVRIRVVAVRSGRILVAAARSGRFYGLAMHAGHLYSVAGGGRGFPGGGRRAAGVRLTSPTAVTTDAADNVLIALYGAHRLVVLADRTGRSYGQPMTAGRVYLIAGNGARETFRCAWSVWRRRHQVHARWHHYQAQLQAASTRPT